MCGFFVAIKKNGYFLDNEISQFKKLTDVIAHRGPDSFGYKCLSTLKSGSKKPNIFLGHRRLSILDLSTDGRQPFFYDNVYCVFNGEIYNYLELRIDLKKKGYIFKTKTDTEVILKIYKEYGIDGFKYLNGMWSFVLLDIEKKTLIVSRDRFSIKPLYTYEDERTLYYSSEIKQLLPILPSKQINKKVIFKFLQQSIIEDTRETFFCGVNKIGAQTTIVYNFITKEKKEKKYWNYQTQHNFPSNNIIEKFMELFTDSIKIRLRSDVAVGGLLSGGLDSSAITVLADKILNNSLQTFSVVSGNKKYSEEKFIDILVKEKKIQNKKILFNPDDVLNNIDNTLQYQDEPFGSFSVVAQFIIYKKIREISDIKVVLSGQGGDELLLGYLKYYFFYLKQSFRDKAYFQFMSSLFASILQRTVVWQFNLSMAKRYLPSMARKKMPFINYSGELAQIWKSNSMQERQIADLRSFSVPALTRYEDRNAMAHSIETRLPFLDYRLVEFMLNLPDKLKLKNGWTKYILRKSMTELPNSIKYRRDKKGFVIPEEKWIKSDLVHLIKEKAKNSILSQMDIVDNKKFIEFYDDYLSGRNSIAFTDITRFYIAELWAEKYFNF